MNAELTSATRPSGSGGSVSAPSLPPKAAENGAQEIDAELPQLSVSEEDLAGGLSLTDLLLRHDLQPSRSAVRRLASGGGLLLDGERQSNPDQPLQAWQLGRRLSLGKKRHYLLQAP